MDRPAKVARRSSVRSGRRPPASLPSQRGRTYRCRGIAPRRLRGDGARGCPLLSGQKLMEGTSQRQLAQGAAVCGIGGGGRRQVTRSGKPWTLRQLGRRRQGGCAARWRGISPWTAAAEEAMVARSIPSSLRKGPTLQVGRGTGPFEILKSVGKRFLLNSFRETTFL